MSQIIPAWEGNDLEKERASHHENDFVDADDPCYHINMDGRWYLAM